MDRIYINLTTTKTQPPDTLHIPHTKGVRTLLGDPKKAVIKLSIPIIMGMLTHVVYHLTDAIFIAWLPSNATESLAAVGFIFPLQFITMAVANGIGTGGGAAISRKIGAKDREGANNVASHTVVVMLALAVLFTAAILLMSEPLVRGMGGRGEALRLAVIYARILFSFSIFLFFLQVSTAILRSEGDSKRAMYVMAAGTILNIILDPVFILKFKWGVAGAACATILSMGMVSLVCFYWLFLEKKTYVSFKFKGFRFDRNIIKDIARVGLPSSVSQMSIALMIISLNKIISMAGGTDGVTVFIVGWRIVSIATLPMVGVSSAVVTIIGAAYGAKEFKKIRITYMYAVKIGTSVETLIGVTLFILAPQIAWLFTQSEGSARITDDLIWFLRIIGLFFPTIPTGMISAALFQGVGKGGVTLIMTIIRTIIFTVPLVWFLGISLDYGLMGIWTGIIGAGILSVPMAFGWSMYYMQRIKS